MSEIHICWTSKGMQSFKQWIYKSCNGPSLSVPKHVIGSFPLCPVDSITPSLLQALTQCPCLDIEYGTWCSAPHWNVINRDTCFNSWWTGSCYSALHQDRSVGSAGGLHWVITIISLFLLNEFLLFKSTISARKTVTTMLIYYPPSLWIPFKLI